MAEADIDFPRYVYVPWVDEEPHAERASAARKIAASVAVTQILVCLVCLRGWQGA